VLVSLLYYKPSVNGALMPPATIMTYAWALVCAAGSLGYMYAPVQLPAGVLVLLVGGMLVVGRKPWPSKRDVGSALGEVVAAILAHEAVVAALSHIIVSGINEWVEQPDLLPRIQRIIDTVGEVDAAESASKGARRAGETSASVVGQFLRGVIAGDSVKATSKLASADGEVNPSKLASADGEQSAAVSSTGTCV